MKPFGPLSIRMLVALVVMLPIAVTATVLLATLTLTSQQMGESMAQALLGEAVDRVRMEVTGYLTQAVRVSEVYERRIQDGVLSGGKFDGWNRALLDDLSSLPAVASICYGDQHGRAVWLLRDEAGLEFGLAEQGKQSAWRVDEISGRRIDPIPRDIPYDPRQRPWYRSAIDLADPHWTPIYFWFQNRGEDSVTGSSFVRTVTDPSGHMLGVVGVDVTLAALSDFLRRLPLADAGSVFVVDESGYLVAASSGKVNSAEGKRLHPGDSSAVAGRTAAELLKAPLETMQTVVVNGEQARAVVAPLRPQLGIEWKVIAIVPESQFMETAIESQRQGLALASVAGLASVAVGWMLSRRLSGSLERLSSHVRRVGRGDFNSRLRLHAAKELVELSDELNRMAGELQRRMELERGLALATEVQQGLLPAASPVVPGLDVYGRSIYCDSAGGDYLDYIDSANLPDGRILIGVGDVTGHGIAAALLMATARAAVRVASRSEESLGRVMTTVNQTLTGEMRHGLFMTMTLLVLDPQRGAVRWSCAGHDPMIIYDPTSDSFIELKEGTVPLGVLSDVEYEQYERTVLGEGSIVLLGTDGIWESRNAASEMFGKDRLRDILRSCSRLPATEIAKVMEQRLWEFLGNRPIQDDVTYVIAKVTQAAVRKPDGDRDALAGGVEAGR